MQDMSVRTWLTGKALDGLLSAGRLPDAWAVQDAIRMADTAIAMLSQQPDYGWTPWSGGTCPVDREARVEVIFKSTERATAKAKHVGWAHFGIPGDVTAYRIVKGGTP
jgi:hypothetical protein